MNFSRINLQVPDSKNGPFSRDTLNAKFWQEEGQKYAGEEGVPSNHISHYSVTHILHDIIMESAASGAH